ncbi:MAG: hypothetical protein E7365_02325 [Clostridiales bacterium]|nr:hypothetical protein [Clostridiales bacterium]
MSRQRAGKTEYRVYYGTDRNAALEPQYVPQPKKRQTTKANTSAIKQQKAARKAAIARCTALTMLVMCVAAMGFLVVTRNAEIYNNNREIRALANEKTDLQLLINTVEKDGSVGGELNSYFDIAQNQLQLQYPEANDIVTVVLPSVSDDVVAEQTQEGEDVFDTVLDWLSSLERRIKSWA